MSLFHEAKTTILGNTAGPAEVRWTRGAEPKKVAKLRICTEYGGGQNREPHKEWHTVILFGRLADQAEKFVTRPMMVYVEGRPQTRRWQNDQGQDVPVHEVIANTLRPVGYQKGDANAAAQPQHGQSGAHPGDHRQAPPSGGQPRAPQPQGQPSANQASGTPPQGPGQVNAPAPGNFGGTHHQAGYDYDDFDEDHIPF